VPPRIYVLYIFFYISFLDVYNFYEGTRGNVVVKALCCKPEGPDEVDFSNLPNPSGRIMALWSTEPLTEMSTRNLKKKNWG
jgi:hypothetical protein